MSIAGLQKYGINGPVKGKYIIAISTKWCKSCKLLQNRLENFRDEGLIELDEIDIAEYGKLAQALDIHTLPSLIFFKDGELLSKTIEIDGEVIVNKGVMSLAFTGEILREIIEKI